MLRYFEFFARYWSHFYTIFALKFPYVPQIHNKKIPKNVLERVALGMQNKHRVQFHGMTPSVGCCRSEQLKYLSLGWPSWYDDPEHPGKHLYFVTLRKRFCRWPEKRTTKRVSALPFIKRSQSSTLQFDARFTVNESRSSIFARWSPAWPRESIHERINLQVPFTVQHVLSLNTPPVEGLPVSFFNVTTIVLAAKVRRNESHFGYPS